MKQLIALVFLVIMVFGVLYLIWEVNNAPEIEDEDDYARPPKEDLK